MKPTCRVRCTGGSRPSSEHAAWCRSRNQFRLREKHQTLKQCPQNRQRACWHFFFLLLQRTFDTLETHRAATLVKRSFNCFRQHKKELEIRRRKNNNPSTWNLRFFLVDCLSPKTNAHIHRVWGKKYGSHMLRGFELHIVRAEQRVTELSVTIQILKKTKKKNKTCFWLPEEPYSTSGLRDSNWPVSG